MSSDVMGSAVPRRFVRFCIVGASGVLVNLGVLALLVEGLSLHANTAAALAIEASILSNFLVNDRWTFGDRREGAVSARLARFHVVSLVGAIVQWTVFVTVNATWHDLVIATGAAGDGWGAWLATAVLTPPDTGWMRYLAQLTGIAVAIAWNFGMNLGWTWRESRTVAAEAA